MRPRAMATALLAASLALTLAACKGDERGRQVKLDKGTYQGPRDGEIDAATHLALKERMLHQSDGVPHLASDGAIPGDSAPATGRVAAQNY